MEIPRCSALDTCCICLENYTDYKSSEPIYLKCKHIFHYNCLAAWRDSGKNSCPICRRNIVNITWKVNYTGSEMPYDHFFSDITSPSLKEFVQIKKGTAEFWQDTYLYTHLIDDFIDFKRKIDQKVAAYIVELEVDKERAAASRTRDADVIYFIACLVTAVVVFGHPRNKPPNTSVYLPKNPIIGS